MTLQAQIYTLETFFEDCRAALLADDGPDGQEAVRRRLVELLKHEKIVRDAIGPDPKPGRYLLGHDDRTDMYAFAHVYDSAGVSKAHDHGPCWIIYGNLTGHTDMIDYVRRDDGSKPGHADLAETRRYRVEAGQAVLFPVGAIHETAHPDGPSMLVRVISGDMDSVWRHIFDPATKTVKDRPPRPEKD